jgi:hypothetical protein
MTEPLALSLRLWASADDTLTDKQRAALEAAADDVDRLAGLCVPGYLPVLLPDGFVREVAGWTRPTVMSSDPTSVVILACDAAVRSRAAA